MGQTVGWKLEAGLQGWLWLWRHLRPSTLPTDKDNLFDDNKNGYKTPAGVNNQLTFTSHRTRPDS